MSPHLAFNYDTLSHEKYSVVHEKRIILSQQAAEYFTGSKRTRLRCDGIFSDDFSANLLLRLAVKKF